jgi:hypothetical protein
MATSAIKIQPGMLSLHTYNTYRDMMTFQAPSKKPICQRYQRGECSGKCPYFHPTNLVSHYVSFNMNPVNLSCSFLISRLNPLLSKQHPQTPENRSPPRTPRNPQHNRPPAPLPQRSHSHQKKMKNLWAPSNIHSSHVAHSIVHFCS